MSKFFGSDRIVRLADGRRVHLRLSFGALAQSMAELGVADFSALAQFMRAEPGKTMTAFTQAMAEAAGQGYLPRQDDLPQLAPVIADMLEAAFGTAQETPHLLKPANKSSTVKSQGADIFKPLLALAAQVFHMPPSLFWQQPIADFLACLPKSDPPMNRAALQLLQDAFPDKDIQNDTD